MKQLVMDWVVWGALAVLGSFLGIAYMAIH